MKIKILSPLWGHEHLPLNVFLDKIRLHGYDGIDTWVPDTAAEKRTLYNYLQAHELNIVTHQHRASGSTFEKFRQSFTANLRECAEAEPLLINSHTGKDHFSLQQHLDLIDTASEFSAKTGITVAHETHRGRLGYSPQMIAEVFEHRPEFCITADFSHWVCVTESMLQNFGETVKEAIKRSLHIHARVGFEQGPQIPDPRAPEHSYALAHFLNWWDEIVFARNASGSKTLCFSTEFGPIPYMPTIPFSNTPVADQFEINCFMLNMLRERYAAYK